MPNKKNLFLIIITLFLVYLYGTDILPFRGEEDNRVLVAYEMVKSGDFFNLTHFGKSYYNKPPLFNWVIVLSTYLMGWNEIAVRLISVLSVFLTAYIIFLISKELLKNDKLSICASLIYLSFADTVLFYGFLGEIDAFLTLLFTLQVYFLFFFLKEKKELMALSLASFIGGIMFLTKGFPALYHTAVNVALFLLYYSGIKSLFKLRILVAPFLFIFPVVSWVLCLQNPFTYFNSLYFQAVIRTPMKETGLITHLFNYPLLNLKQLLPYSPLLIFIKRIRINRDLMMFLALIVLSYLPYLISPGARGRYILIFFPILAIFFALIMEKVSLEKVSKIVFNLSIILLPISLLLEVYNLEILTYFDFSPLLIITPLTVICFTFFVAKNQNFIFTSILLFSILKMGYMNYHIPFMMGEYVEKKSAYAVASQLDDLEQIEFKGINPRNFMLYLDIYTQGLVTKRGEELYLTKDDREWKIVIKQIRSW